MTKKIQVTKDEPKVHRVTFTMINGKMKVQRVPFTEILTTDITTILADTIRRLDEVTDFKLLDASDNDFEGCSDADRRLAQLIELIDLIRTEQQCPPGEWWGPFGASSSIAPSPVFPAATGRCAADCSISGPHHQHQPPNNPRKTDMTSTTKMKQQTDDRQLVIDLIEAASEFIRFFEAYNKHNPQPWYTDAGGRLAYHSVEVLGLAHHIAGVPMPKDIKAIYEKQINA
jgi:hypothetical protein